jgi:hypothetical protein
MHVQHIETLRPPAMYSDGQIRFALGLALQLNRGKLLLCERPYKL